MRLSMRLSSKYRLTLRMRNEAYTDSLIDSEKEREESWKQTDLCETSVKQVRNLERCGLVSFICILHVA